MESFYKVFLQPRYVVVSLLVAFGIFTVSVWLPNAALIQAVLVSNVISLQDKGMLLLSLYGSISTNFTVVSASYTITIAVLFGINISLLLYYVQKVKDRTESIKVANAAGIGGLISGVFGIGCAACGTFVLTSVFTIVGAGGLVALLPFGGEEFGFLGIMLLIYSIYSLTKKISQPKVCPI